MDKPLGVSKDGLRFSWSFEDPDANEYQSAYRIVVASSKAQLLQKEYNGVFDRVVFAVIDEATLNWLRDGFEQE